MLSKHHAKGFFYKNKIIFKKARKKKTKKKKEQNRRAQSPPRSVTRSSERVIQYQEPSFPNMTQGAGIGVYTVILRKERSLISTAPHLHVGLDIIIGRCT